MATETTDGKWLKPVGIHLLLTRPASEDIVYMGKFPPGHDFQEGEDLSGIEVIEAEGSDELRERVTKAFRESDAAPAVYQHIEQVLPDVKPGEV